MKYFVWWQSEYGPAMRQFDNAGAMIHFILGWSIVQAAPIYPEHCAPGSGGFQLTIA